MPARQQSFPTSRSSSRRRWSATFHRRAAAPCRLRLKARLRPSRRFLWLFALAWAGRRRRLCPIPDDSSAAPRGRRRRRRKRPRPGAHHLLRRDCGQRRQHRCSAGSATAAAARRPWIAAGLALSCRVRCVAMPLAKRHVADPGGWSCCWQLALNMMLGPLSAWAADRVPRANDGLPRRADGAVAGDGRAVRGHRHRSRACRARREAGAGRVDGRGLRPARVAAHPAAQPPAVRRASAICRDRRAGSP